MHRMLLYFCTGYFFLDVVHVFSACMLVFFYIYLKYACMRRLIGYHDSLLLSVTDSTHLLLDSHSLPPPPPFSLAFLERINFSSGEFVEKKEGKKGYQRTIISIRIIPANN